MRLVAEAREQEPELSLNAAVKRIGPRVGINPDTLPGWCKQADIDAGRAPGVTTTDGKRIKELEREVRELKRANEILLAAPRRRRRRRRSRRSCWCTGSRPRRGCGATSCRG